jgi:hypothetical protein
MGGWRGARDASLRGLCVALGLLLAPQNALTPFAVPRDPIYAEPLQIL